MAVALLLGTGSLLLFLTPAQILESVSLVSWQRLGQSYLFFLLGALAAVLRWRACLNFRVSTADAFHSVGVALGANLHIPGRVGEPLRVFCLTRRGLAAEYGTSGLVQERLWDQIFRVVFFAFALVLGGLSDGADLSARLTGIVVVTVGLLLALVFLIHFRERVSKVLGSWFGRIPKLSSEGVEGFVFTTLGDLAESRRRPGSPKALIWGLLCWGLFMIHTQLILEAFLPGDTLALAAVLMATVSPTAPTQPGLFHGVALATLLLFSADRTLALQAIIVLHLMQTLFFSVWAMTSWFILMRDEPA